MSRHKVTITTPDGRCPATLHVPQQDQGTSGLSAPGVILYPDAGGVREALAQMADRLAALGYVTLLPDVYYREGHWAPIDINTAFTDPRERVRVRRLMAGLTPERIDSDARSFLDFITARPEVCGDKVGLTGYCMGGRMALRAAGVCPDKVAAVAAIHAGHLADPDDPGSPHLRAGAITAVVLIAAARHDASFPPAQERLLHAVLVQAGVQHTIETYPARHGFAVPDHAAVYDESAAERHWKALEDLFGATLGDSVSS